MYYITQKQGLSTDKTNEHKLLGDSLSLIDIDVIWLLSLVYLFMRIITSFLRYNGYLNFIKDLCVPLGAYLFLFCYERDFMLSLSGTHQVEMLLKHSTIP